MGSFLLAFQPLHVNCPQPTSSGAFGYKAREGLRSILVHKSLLGALPKHARLPVPGLLVAMLAVCQLPKLSACFGI